MLSAIRLRRCNPAALSVLSRMIPIKPDHIWESEATRRTLADVEGAANFLLIKWPGGMMDTPAHRAAQVAALDVLGGNAAPEAFRRALIAAADEAGILAADTLRSDVPARLGKGARRPRRVSED